MLLVYCLFIVIASLVGGWLPTLVRMTHLRLQLTLSAVAGVMLGVGTLHLLPHSIRLVGGVESTMAIMLGGVLFMFFLNRVFHFHQHGTAEEAAEACAVHGREHNASSQHHELGSADLSSLGLLVGLTIHTLIDGIALGAAAFAHPGDTWLGSGFAVFLAIALHKPLDAMSVTSLMGARRWSQPAIALANIAIALTAPLGVWLFASGISIGTEHISWWIGAAMAFAAGTFLCISLGDLLPEVHFHKHDRLWLSAALLCGLAVPIVLELLPGHTHQVPGDVVPAAKQAAD